MRKINNIFSKYLRNKLLIFWLLFFVIILLSPDRSIALTPQEEYEKIQKEIKTHKKKLSEVRKRESSILNEIEKTNKELKKTEYELSRLRKKLNLIESNITKLESEIVQKNNIIEKYNEWLKRKLNAIYKYRKNSDILMLFADTDDVSQLIRRAKFLEYITTYEHKLLNDYKKSLEDLKYKEKELYELRTELIKNREKIKTQEAILSKKKKEKEILLISVRREGSSYNRMLKELEEASKRLLEIIRESERKDEYTATGFSSLKGKLPWPLDGHIVIPYGTQKDPQFHTPIFRSGTYIQSDKDLYAKAVYKGKVVFAEWFKGYGQLVIINHGDGYHTLYGSLSEIFTNVGDIIDINQKIGKVGNSGILNSPGLYFEIRYKGKPLDPLQWLRKNKS